MPNANIIELETCLDDCLRVFQQDPQAEYSKLYLEPVLQMKRRWQKAIDASERSHIRWRKEEREELITYKRLANTLREVQQDLRRIGALDFPESRVMYWDTELLLSAVGPMQAYLAEHRGDIDFASDYLERFDRLVSGGAGEQRDVDSSLKDFQRFVDLRREALHEVTSLIGEVRVGMRRLLGKKDPVYQSIHWPYAVASDENVLF